MSKKKQDKKNSIQLSFNKPNQAKKAKQNKEKFLLDDSMVEIDKLAEGPNALITSERALDLFYDEAKEGQFARKHFENAIEAADKVNGYARLNDAINKLLDKWEERYKDKNKKLNHQIVIEFQKGFFKYKNKDISKRIKNLTDMANIRRIGLIFISYPRIEEKYVKELENYLKNEGFLVWFDENISTGDNWSQSIKNNIHECSIMIVVMTPKSEKSEEVHKEIDIAEELEKPIFPLLLKGNGLKRLEKLQYTDVKKGILPPKSFIDDLQNKCE